MKLRPIKQLGKDSGNLLSDDAWPIVHNRDAELRGLAGRDRLAVRDDFELDGHIGQDAGLFACVERVVDRFLHAGQERLARVIETQQVPVLGKKFCNRNFPLTRAHFDRRHLL